MRAKSTTSIVPLPSMSAALNICRRWVVWDGCARAGLCLIIAVLKSS